MNPLTQINKIPDTLAIVSSTGRLKPNLIPEIQEYYQNFGYQVRFGKSCFQQRQLNRPDDRMRAKELLDALEDPSVAAVIFARGGEYSERILNYLPQEEIRKSSKIIIGFSDVSSILSFFVENSRCKVYHGPMATDVLMSGERQTHMLGEILKGRLKKITMEEVGILQPGECKGVLKGGCISVLSKLLERDLNFTFDNCIVFIEDVHESVRSLFQIFEKMKQAGKLIRIKGLLFGEMIHCSGGATRNFWPDFIEEVIQPFFSRFNIPIGYNIRSGHGRNEFYLPLGEEVRVRLHPKKSTLDILSRVSFDK